MRSIATDDPVAWCISVPVSPSATRLGCAKTAEQIEVLFGVETVVLYGIPDLPTVREEVRRGLRQITLFSCWLCCPAGGVTDGERLVVRA